MIHTYTNCSVYRVSMCKWKKVGLVHKDNLSPPMPLEDLQNVAGSHCLVSLHPFMILDEVSLLLSSWFALYFRGWCCNTSLFTENAGCVSGWHIAIILLGLWKFMNVKTPAEHHHRNDTQEAVGRFKINVEIWIVILCQQAPNCFPSASF